MQVSYGLIELENIRDRLVPRSSTPAVSGSFESLTAALSAEAQLSLGDGWLSTSPKQVDAMVLFTVRGVIALGPENGVNEAFVELVGAGLEDRLELAVELTGPSQLIRCRRRAARLVWGSRRSLAGRRRCPPLR